MTFKCLLLCACMGFSMSVLMATEELQDGDSATKGTTQKVVVVDQQPFDALEEMRLEIEKMKEERKKMAEEIELLKKKTMEQPTKVGIQAPSDTPQDQISTVTTIVTVYEDPIVTKEDVMLATEKLKRETDRVVDQVGKEIHRDAKRFGKFVDKVCQQVKEHTEPKVTVVTYTTPVVTLSSSHINVFKIPTVIRQQTMGWQMDLSNLDKLFPGLDGSTFYQMDLNSFCKSQEGMANLEPSHFAVDPAVMLILNRFGITSVHCMSSVALYSNMSKKGVQLTKDQVRWLGYAAKGVMRK